MGKACRPGRDGVTLAVGDLHAPFMHRDFPRFLAAVKGQFRPTRTVLLGDIVDLHALSRFTRNPSGLSAWDELKAARRQLRPVYGLFPDAAVCWGNHDTRLKDRAAEAGIPAEAVAPMLAVIGHPPGWEWRERWDIGGVTYEHGTGYTGKDAHIKAATANMGPTVIGHIHAHAALPTLPIGNTCFSGSTWGAGSTTTHTHSLMRKPSRPSPLLGAGWWRTGFRGSCR
jgi:hypothetical protein